MNRSDLIGIETDSARRRITAPFELRKEANGSNSVTYRGIASTTETEYPVFGGSFPGWKETVARGAFKKTLRENADVSFLVNHDGITLARTKSGTMTLREIDKGLEVTANLDLRQNVVNDLYVASERGDIDEMSFAFRVTRDEWFDADGNRSNEYEGVARRILEVNLNKGDVSAVNYGANDATSGGFREVEMALAELRDGREITDKQREVIRGLARAVGEQPEVRADGLDQFALYLTQLENVTTAMREHMNSMMGPDKIGPDGTFLAPTQTNAVTMFDGVEALAALRAHWELRRDPAESAA